MKRIHIITPFLILSVISLIYSIWNHLFDFWTLTGGASLIGVFAIAGLVVSIILFLIDRKLLRIYNLKNVYLIEIVVIILIGIFYFYETRRLICELNDDVEYFVIVYGIEAQPGLNYSFPFNKKISIDNNGCYLVNNEDNFSNGNKIIRTNIKSNTSIVHNLKVDDKVYKTELVTINNFKVDYDSLETKIGNLIQRKYKKY